jgi:hypothetical protein
MVLINQAKSVIPNLPFAGTFKGLLESAKESLSMNPLDMLESGVNALSDQFSTENVKAAVEKAQTVVAQVIPETPAPVTICTGENAGTVFTYPTPTEFLFGKSPIATDSEKEVTIGEPAKKETSWSSWFFGNDIEEQDDQPSLFGRTTIFTPDYDSEDDSTFSIELA